MIGTGSRATPWLLLLVALNSPAVDAQEATEVAPRAEGVVAGGAHASLADLLSLAFDHNPRLAAARYRLTAASELLARTHRSAGPNLRMTAEGLRYGELPPNKVNLLGPGDWDITVGLGIDYLLFSQLRAGNVDAASARVLVALQQVRRVQQEVVLQVSASYYELWRLQQRLVVDQQALTQMEFQLAVVRDMYRAGKAAEVDTLRAEVQLANAQQRLITSDNAVTIAGLRLENAVGVGLEAMPSPGPFALPEVTEVQDIEPVADLVERGYQQRPEMLAAHAQLLGLQAERVQAAAGLKPEVRAVGNYMREGTSFALDYDSWYLGLRVTIPLTDNGATAHSVDAVEAEIDAALRELESVKQLVRLEVTDSWLAIRAAAERLEAMRAAVTQAQRAFEIEQRRYELGANTILDVLTAQTTLTGTHYDLIEAHAAYLVSRVRLQVAIGADAGQAANLPSGDTEQ